MFATLKTYLIVGAAAVFCALVVTCSVMYARMSSQATKIETLSATVAQQKRDADALNSALVAKDAALADAAAKAASVKTAVDPLRNTDSDREISPIMRRYLEELSK